MGTLMMKKITIRRSRSTLGFLVSPFLPSPCLLPGVNDKDCFAGKRRVDVSWLGGGVTRIGVQAFLWVVEVESGSHFLILPDHDFAKQAHIPNLQKVYMKFIAMFRVSRKPFPYEDLSPLLSQVLSSFDANHVMWGRDFVILIS
ncbi:hypothetical protein L1987_80615 [Smallanthus sonchifolius]|uniref:Uncharacterized protein n=1 Tax=Smallanthus sonchifolius TaxID=185202 RepID=A0ACB8YPD7_9ASTR|nr:hypothetical protein L1987_80615 [Smallanthus sonchifolius]